MLPITTNNLNTMTTVHENLYKDQRILRQLLFICFLRTFVDVQINQISKLTPSKHCKFSFVLCKKKIPVWITRLKISSILQAICLHLFLTTSKSFLSSLMYIVIALPLQIQWPSYFKLVHLISFKEFDQSICYYTILFRKGSWISFVL